MKKPSAAQIVPVALQHRLQQHAFQGDVSAWSQGDIAALLEDEYSITKADGTVVHTVPLGELHNAIGVFAGKAGQTIRDYARLSRLVPEELRTEFDVLGRHHHRAISSVAKGDVEKHRELANRWLERADDFGGQIGSVGALRIWLKDRRHNVRPWESKLVRAKSLMESLSEERDVPPAVKQAALGFLAAVGG